MDGLPLKYFPIYARKIATCLVECRPFKVVDIHFPVALSLIDTYFDLVNTTSLRLCSLLFIFCTILLLKVKNTYFNKINLLYNLFENTIKDESFLYRFHSLHIKSGIYRYLHVKLTLLHAIVGILFARLQILYFLHVLDLTKLL